MPDPEGGPARIDDSLAETLAEEFLESATRGEDAVEEALEAVVPEELGGPFIETSAADEFALDTDDANPEDAEPEPLPRPVAGLVQPAYESALLFGEEGGEEGGEEVGQGGGQGEEGGYLGGAESGGPIEASLGPASYHAGGASSPEEVQPVRRRRRR